MVCVSTPLPTIKDGAEWGEVAAAETLAFARFRDPNSLAMEIAAALEHVKRQRAAELCAFLFSRKQLGWPRCEIRAKSKIHGRVANVG